MKNNFEIITGLEARNIADENDVYILPNSSEVLAINISNSGDIGIINLKGSFQCHVCKKQFPFNDQVFVVSGMGGREHECPSCHNFISLTNNVLVRSDKGVVILQASPYTHLQNKPVHKIHVSIESIELEKIC